MRGRVRGLFLGMKATPWSYLLPSQVGQAIFYIISLGKQMSICQNDEDFLWFIPASISFLILSCHLEKQFLFQDLPLLTPYNLIAVYM